METDYQPRGNPMPAHLFCKACGLLRACGLQACAVYLMLIMPFGFLFSCLLGFASTLSPSYAWMGRGAVWLGVLAVNALGGASVLCLFRQHATRTPVSLRAALSGGLHHWGSMAIVSLLSPLVTCNAGFMMFTYDPPGALARSQTPSHHESLAGAWIVPLLLFFVWLAQRLYVTTVAVVADNLTPWKALRQSWRLTRNHFWETLNLSIGLGLLGWLCSWLISWLLHLPLHAITDTSGLMIKSSLPAYVENASLSFVADPLGLFATFCVAMHFCYYQELEVRQQEDEALRREDDAVRQQLEALSQAGTSHSA